MCQDHPTCQSSAGDIDRATVQHHPRCCVRSCHSVHEPDNVDCNQHRKQWHCAYNITRNNATALRVSIRRWSLRCWCRWWLLVVLIVPLVPWKYDVACSRNWRWLSCHLRHIDVKEFSEVWHREVFQRQICGKGKPNATEISSHNYIRYNILNSNHKYKISTIEKCHSPVNVQVKSRSAFIKQERMDDDK